MRLKLLFVFCLLCTALSAQSGVPLMGSSWQGSSVSGIAFVNGPTPVAKASAATTSITYSPTNGNTVVLGLGTASTVTATTCKDNNNVVLTAGPTITATSELQYFYYTATGSPTSFSCSWTTSRTSGIAVGEYSGVASVNPNPTSNTGSGSASPMTVSPVSTVTNDFMVAFLYRGGAVTTWTAATGNLRKSLNSANGSTALVDNTSGGSSGSGVTESATVSIATTWTGAAIELVPAANTFTLVQKVNCTIPNPGTTCTLSVSPNLAAGNLDIFDCYGSTSASMTITGITNAGGTLINAPGSSTGGYQTGGTGNSEAIAYILPSTSTGGAGNPVITISATSHDNSGYCYLAEYHPNANPTLVGLDIDTAYQMPSASTTLTNSTAVTPSSTNYVALQGAMSLDTFGILTAVASPYNTNAFLPGTGWVGFSTAAPGNGNWASWTDASSTGLLQSIYFGFSPTACQASTFVDFEGSTNGTAVTNTLVNSSIYGWQGGQWTSTINLLKFASAASMPLASATGRLCDGTSKGSGLGSLGIQVVGTGSAAIDFIEYQWGMGNDNQNIIASMKFNENLLANSNSDQDCISIHGASDFASCNAYGTGATRYIGLETIGGNGSFFNAPGGTWVGTCPCTLILYYDSGSGGITATPVTAAVVGGTVTFTGTFTPAQWPANFVFTPSGCTGGTNYNGQAFLVQTSSVSTVTASATSLTNGGATATTSGATTTCTLTGQHLIQVYNSSNVLIGNSFHAGTPTSYPAQYLIMGTPNNQAIPTGKFMQFDSLQISLNGVVPLL